MRQANQSDQEKAAVKKDEIHTIGLEASNGSAAPPIVPEVFRGKSNDCEYAWLSVITPFPISLDAFF